LPGGGGPLRLPGGPVARDLWSPRQGGLVVLGADGGPELVRARDWPGRRKPARGSVLRHPRPSMAKGKRPGPAGEPAGPEPPCPPAILRSPGGNGGPTRRRRAGPLSPRWPAAPYSSAALAPSRLSPGQGGVTGSGLEAACHSPANSAMRNVAAKPPTPPTAAA